MKTEFDPFISEWKSYVTNSKLNLVEKCLKLAQILEYPNLDIKKENQKILHIKFHYLMNFYSKNVDLMETWKITITQKIIS